MTVVTYPPVPVGVMHQFAGSTAPNGYLLCDGAAVSRTTYASLFTVLSTTYGSGDGSTTFNIPDLRGRIPIGAGTGAQNGGSGSGAISGGTALAVRSIGQFSGDERLQSHTHTGTVGTTNTDHTHNQNNATGGGAITGSAGVVSIGTANGQASATTTSGMNANVTHTHTFTGGAHDQSQGASQNMPPFIVTNYIIKI